MFEQIRAKTAALNEQIAALQKEAAEMIKPMLSEFIKANPQVEQVYWTQYTPYFNDGDPCVFRVNEPYFVFIGDDEEYDAWSISKSEYAPAQETCSAETAAACSALAKELASLDGPLETLFGDHVKVIVTAGGVDVDEYSHD
jgi:hypothetical protein